MAGPLVYDEEHRRSAEAVSNALVQLNTLFSNYISAINKLTTEGIVEGMTGDALKAYASQAAIIQKAISVIADGHQRAVKCFLSEVNTTDQSIF